MARNQKLSYKMNMFHFLTKQNYSKYSQISMSMSFSSSEASTMFRSSTASSTSESVIFSKGLSLFLSSTTDNCDFSCWRPAWQGSFGLKQWILSSSDPSFARLLILFLFYDLCKQLYRYYKNWSRFDLESGLGKLWLSRFFGRGRSFEGGRLFEGAFIRGGVYSRKYGIWKL